MIQINPARKTGRFAASEIVFIINIFCHYC